MEPLPETREVVEDFGPFDDDDALLQDLLDLGDQVRDVVPDCVGLSLTSREHGLTFTVVASDEETAVLDALQYLDDGPCTQGAEEDRVVTYEADDPTDEQTWRLFAAGTAAAAVRSSLSLPVIAGDVVVSHLNLYAASGRAFDGHHEELARILGAWAPGATTNADLSFATRAEARLAPKRMREQLVVQRATSMVAARLDVDLRRAEQWLHEAAQRAGVGLQVLALKVVDLLTHEEGT